MKAMVVVVKLAMEVTGAAIYTGVGSWHAPQGLGAGIISISSSILLRLEFVGKGKSRKT
jgi:hypothetical protein